MANRLDQHLFGDGVFKHRFHQLITGEGDSVKKLLSFLLSFGKQLGRDLRYAQLVHVRTFVKVERLHRNKINNPFNAILKSDWDLHQQGIQAQFFDELVLYFVGVCTGSVTFVDKGDSGYFVPLHLPVNGDRLALYSTYGAQDKNCTV